jgi:hypothetical protein
MVEAEQILTLSSSESGLTLSMASAGVPGWWHVHLVRSGTQQVLGAEVKGYILTRLLLFLQDTRHELHWVLTLSERHVTFYGKRAQDRVELHIQDADAIMFAELVLTPTEAQEWTRVLSAALHEPRA